MQFRDGPLNCSNPCSNGPALMSLLDKLERRLGFLAVPNVTLGLIVCQAFAYFLTLTPRDVDGENPLVRLFLIPNLVLAGEVWRLVTFLVVPPFTNVIFALFFWYVFYLMGTALEHYWGVFRYNVYLLIGYAATVAVSFLAPGVPASNGYLQASVFLAFAFLYPEFEMRLFFLIPVQIKWLALLAWIGYGWILLFGSWIDRLLVAASICNFLLFFGWEIFGLMRAGRRRMALRAAEFATAERTHFHRCTVCGITDRTHPTMEFRYCSKCQGACGYCTEHLTRHEHV